MSTCRSCSQHPLGCLHRVPLFHSLSTDQLGYVFSLIRQRDYETGAVLFREGDDLTDLVIVRSGALKLVRYGTEGQEYLVETLFTGDFYGGDQLLAKSQVRETGIAAEPLGVCLISRNDLKNLMLKDPTLSIEALSHLSAKLDEYRFQIEILSTSDTLKRLAMFLLEHMRRRHSHIIPVSQEDIGNAIHLTKETVNRKMALMQSMGVVEVEGKKQVVVHAPDQLAELAQR